MRHAVGIDNSIFNDPNAAHGRAASQENHGALDGAPWFFSALTRVQVDTRTYAATGLQPLAALAAYLHLQETHHDFGSGNQEVFRVRRRTPDSHGRTEGAQRRGAEGTGPALRRRAWRNHRQGQIAFFLAGDARLSGQPPVAVHRPLFSSSRPVRSKHVYASLRRRRVKAAAAFFVRRWNGAWCRPLAKDAWWAAMFFYMARREFAPGAPIFD